MNSFHSKSTLKVGGKEYEIYRLDALDQQGISTKHLPDLWRQCGTLPLWRDQLQGSFIHFGINLLHFFETLKYKFIVKYFLSNLKINFICILTTPTINSKSIFAH